MGSLTQSLQRKGNWTPSISRKLSSLPIQKTSLHWFGSNVSIKEIISKQDDSPPGLEHKIPIVGVLGDSEALSR